MRASLPDQTSVNGASSDVSSVGGLAEGSRGGSGTRATWQSEQTEKPWRYSAPQSGQYMAGRSLLQAKDVAAAGAAAQKEMRDSPQGYPEREERASPRSIDRGAKSALRSE